MQAAEVGGIFTISEILKWLSKGAEEKNQGDLVRFIYTYINTGWIDEIVAVYIGT